MNDGISKVEIRSLKNLEEKGSNTFKLIAGGDYIYKPESYVECYILKKWTKQAIPLLNSSLCWQRNMPKQLPAPFLLASDEMS